MGAQDTRLLAGFLGFVEWARVRESIARRAASHAGRLWARTLEPEVDAAEVLLRLIRSQEALELLEDGDEATPDLSEVSDLEQAFERARHEERSLTTRELSSVAATILACTRARSAFAEHPRLLELVAEAEEPAEEDLGLAQEIERTIGPYGVIVDEASERLAHIRRKLVDTREMLRLALGDAVMDASIMLAVVEHRAVEYDGQLCLKVKAEEIRRVPGPIIGDEPGFLYVEPDRAREQYNRVRHLELDERTEVFRIARELSSRVLPRREAYERLSQGAIRADIHLAMARYAVDLRLTRPTLAGADDGLRISLRGARHPLLAEGETECVPIDVELGGEHRLLVISGPNGGGKTAAMKTVGLVSVLAQCGCFVPAEAGAVLPVFASFLSVSESRSSVSEGLSTFQAHARDLAAVAEADQEGALVLLDEIGVGTDPTEAASLAQAFLEHELAQPLLALATTHLSPLKAFAQRTSGARNAAVGLDDAGRPTFSLTLGQAGRSYALEVARQSGLPLSICQRAAELHGGEAIP